MLLYHFAVLALEIAAGCLIWFLVGRNVMLAGVPVWVRLYAGCLVSVALAAAGVAFLGAVPAAAGVIGPLPENLIAGCCLIEFHRNNTPAVWARWRRFKKEILGGNRGHFRGYYED